MTNGPFLSLPTARNHSTPLSVSSVSTVLDPDQHSEALELAREVKAAIEAGEIGLHAHELEPFADKLR